MGAFRGFCVAWSESNPTCFSVDYLAIVLGWLVLIFVLLGVGVLSWRFARV